MNIRTLIVAGVLAAAGCVAIASDNPIDKSHGIEYPTGWQNWPTIAVSHRTDNNTLRLIVGNDTAVEAARAGKTNPWPDGAILGKVVWKSRHSDLAKLLGRATRNP